MNSSQRSSQRSTADLIVVGGTDSVETLCLLHRVCGEERKGQLRAARWLFTTRFPFRLSHNVF